MGVPLLWGVLNDAAEYNTLLGLSMEAFEKQPRYRAVRLGCDASIWLFHARKMDTPGEEVGINADLRVLLFRLFTLLRNNVLPFFVFDGPNKPTWKRGQHVGGGWKNGKDKPFKELLDLIGFPWRTAPGEAEAELAACAKRGEIDGVLTDDVDTLLFGAPLVVRNTLHSSSSSAAPSTSQAPPSPTKPSSQLPSSSQPSTPIHADSHKLFYQDLVVFQTGLEVSDLIFCALMSGGDYAEGMMNVGIKTAVGLALCGFGGKLVDGVEERKGDEAELKGFLKEWRKEVVAELKTNSQGQLSTRKPKLALELEADTDFPDLKIVNYYTHPAVSTNAPPPTWDAEPNLTELIPYLSSTFEWSNAEIEMYSRNLLYPGLAIQQLRKSALHHDQSIPRSLHPPSSDSATTFFDSISDLKTSTSTKHISSYRVQLSTSHFARLITSHLPTPDPFPIPTEPGQQVVGRRVRQVEEAKGTSPWRHWVPKELVEAAEEGRRCVREWKGEREGKEKGKGRALGGWAGSSKPGVGGNGARKGKGKKKVVDSDATVTSTGEEEDLPAPAPRPLKSKTKTKPAPTRRRRLSTASTSAASTDEDEERAPPPPKSPRKNKQQESPVKVKKKWTVEPQPQTTYLEISSSDEDEDLPSPNKLARLVFPPASTSTAAVKKLSSSSSSYIPPSPAPSRANSAHSRPLVASSSSSTNRLPPRKSSSQPPAAARKGLIAFSSSKVTTERSTNVVSKKAGAVSGSGRERVSQSRSISIDLSAEEEEDEEEEMLLSLDEALRKSREARGAGTGGGAGVGGRGKGKAPSVRAKGRMKEVEELVLSDSD